MFEVALLAHAPAASSSAATSVRGRNGFGMAGSTWKRMASGRSSARCPQGRYATIRPCARLLQRPAQPADATPAWLLGAERQLDHAGAVDAPELGGRLCARIEAHLLDARRGQRLERLEVPVFRHVH